MVTPPVPQSNPTNPAPSQSSASQSTSTIVPSTSEAGWEQAEIAHLIRQDYYHACGRY